MDSSEARDARGLLDYDKHTAGGLMVTEFLAYADTLLVAGLLADMRSHGERYSDYDAQDTCSTAPDRRLTGVSRLRDLPLSAPGPPDAQPHAGPAAARSSNGLPSGYSGKRLAKALVARTGKVVARVAFDHAGVSGCPSCIWPSGATT